MISGQLFNDIMTLRLYVKKITTGRMNEMFLERKRIFAILLALMLAFSLAACGGADAPAEDTNTDAPVEAPVEESVSIEDETNAFFAELPGIIVSNEDFVAKVQAGEELFVLDIRQADVYAEGHVAGAINAPWNTSALVDNLASIPMDETVYVYCYTGQTAGQTVALLKIAGYDVKSVKYGYNLGISKVEGFESIITTDVAEFDEPQGSEVDPVFAEMITDYFANMNATYGSNVMPAADVKDVLDTEDNSYYVVSIRQAEDYAAGHIPGAINIPFVAGMQESFGDLPMDKTIVIYCYSGQTAGQTVAGLRVLGFDAVSLKSGMGTPVTDPSGWANEGFEVVQ